MREKLCVIMYLIITAFLFIINNVYSQNVIAQNVTEGRPIDLPQNNKTEGDTIGNATGSSAAVAPQGRPSDIPGNGTLNTKKIAMELTELTPTEVSQYPITNLSPEDIKLAFGFLNPPNLAKVLLNIPQEDLVEVKNKLTPTIFNQTLNRLLEADRTQVEDRLSSDAASATTIIDP
jgi:hypothetical protein